MGKLTIRNNLHSELIIEHLNDLKAKKLTTNDFIYIRDYIKDVSNIIFNDGDIVIIKNYYKENDGGGGVFVFDSTINKSEHNGGTILDPIKTFPDDMGDEDKVKNWYNNDINDKGCLKRLFNEPINVKWFGNTNLEVTFKQAYDISGSVVYIPFGTYNLSSNNIDFSDKIYYSFGEVTINSNDTLKVNNIAKLSANGILDLLKTVDGDGSELDADTLDGKEASDLATVNLDNVDDNDILDKLKNVDGKDSGLDTDLFQGKSLDEFSIKADDETIDGSKEFTSDTVKMTNLPTDDPGVDGQLWNDNGTLKVSNG